MHGHRVPVDLQSLFPPFFHFVCLVSHFRQNKLEEALLFSGQFTDALQALIDWLYKVEPQLAEDQPVHGDIDLVMNLIDNHKVMATKLQSFSYYFESSCSKHFE